MHPPGAPRYGIQSSPAGIGQDQQHRSEMRVRGSKICIQENGALKCLLRGRKVASLSKQCA